MPFSRISRDPYQHPAPIIGVPFFGSANNAGTSSCVTLDSGVEGAKYDGDALLRECFNWRESRYVGDTTIHRSRSCILFELKSVTEGPAERGVAGALKRQA
jgi:hypothetical protein